MISLNPNPIYTISYYKSIVIRRKSWVKFCGSSSSAAVTKFNPTFASFTMDLVVRNCVSLSEYCGFDSKYMPCEHFHANLAENASVLMRKRKLPYIAYMLVNYALLYFSLISYHLYSLLTSKLKEFPKA
jgi:hypothetical protein